MAEELTFQTVCGDDSAKFDVVFVHGLTGDPYETWSATHNGVPVYWPNWLCEDLLSARVHALGYPASVFGKWAKKEMTLYERAENVLESLVSNKIGTRPLIFITHSLGGLLVKQILRTANETSDYDWNSVAVETKLVAFLATPHSGACLAGVLKAFAKPFASTHIASLSNDCGQLDDLNSAYRDIAPKYLIKTIAYYEKFKTNNVLLVDHQSANPGISGTRAIALDADHITICKPQTKDALLYQSILRHLQTLTAAASYTTALFGLTDYTKPHPTDRRDMLQKLIDAGREYQYHSAREHQSIFAQKYYRLGLHTDAKNLHDDMLSDVEQRFALHVYERTICKGSTDDEISEAIQKNVIDPVYTKYKSNRLAPIDVLRAIYFLTQQCHIRWDPQ
jgi:hypothetical protein